ncbi:SusC/RagA family TonB-linked outer membrane protein [Pedobacter frigidisoli]|uniref:SusC/RagA family TonB-linked outer membrane protein n=1 Tax=Pedobacter frigidisoli TaxID=2530455 RepID=UPI00293148C2|nr:SusC/RagA family TonB-linked outer membrane protein [Pedobacter frigidisoli]
MKLTTLILILATLQLSANSFAQKITLNERNTPLEKVFERISLQTGFDFLYSTADVRKTNPVSIAIKDMELKKALAQILGEQPLEFSVGNRSVVISRKEKNVFDRIAAIFSAIDVKGRVVDEEGKPLPGAVIRTQDRKISTSTDWNGYFEMKNVEENTTINISYVGFKIKQLIVKSDMGNIKMEIITGQLNDVSVTVNTGYQSISKDRITGAVSVITAKDLEKMPSPNIIQRIEGMASGLQVNIVSGDRSFAYASGSTPSTTQSLSSGTRTIGANDYNIAIRGTGTLQAEKFPLIVVDGVITEFDISTLNPNDIENISILKDAAAASIWGVRAANGVIVITTKRGKANATPSINFNTSFMVADKQKLNYMKLMNSSQTLAYEKELVDRNFLPAFSPSSYFISSYYFYSAGTYLAQKLKAGTITQAQYDAQTSQWSNLDNRSQISDYILQNPNNQQYNFSVSGGTERSTYFYSTSYSKENSGTVGNSGRRITATLNNDWKLFNYATLSTSFKGTFFKYGFNSIGLQSIYSNDKFALMPYQMLADDRGNSLSYNRINPDYTKNLSSAYKDWTYNYLNEQQNSDFSQNDYNYQASVNLRIPILTGLTASAIYNLENSNSDMRTYFNQATFKFRDLVNYYTFGSSSSNSLGISNGGIFQQTKTSQNNYSLRGQLDFERTFKKHQIVALAGAEIRETNIGQGSGTLFGYNPQTGLTNSSINFSSTPTYAYIDGTSATSYTTFNGGGYPTQADKVRRFLSYYSNASYTYDGKYAISGSVRYDDYNNFGLDRSYRATPLWSSGLRWNVSHENFMKPVGWVDKLDIRATYGVNGNLSLSTYPYTNIGVGSNDLVTGRDYASIIALANPELKWEKVYETNIGIDFSLFHSRLNGSVDIYRKDSKDLLYSFPISAVYTGNIGAGYLTRNTASLKGKGLDASLNGMIYSNENFSWTAGFNFSYNTNRVTDSRLLAANYSSNFGNYPLGIGFVNGDAADRLYVYRYAGLDANGLAQVYDQNNNIIAASTSTIASIEVFKNAGRTTAPYYGGFTTGVKYKQFTLAAQATYQFGNVFLKPSIQSYITGTRTVSYDLSADIAQRWIKSGDESNTDVPGLNGTATAVTNSLNRYKYSDINVLKGDYIRLRQLSLNYQLPQELIGKLKIKTAQVGMSVNNIGLLWTANKEGYDPDFANYPGSNRSLPAPVSYNLTLNLNF